MESEADTSESLIVQARDENDIDRRNKQCNISTANQEKEHTGFEDELQTDGTNGDEQRKPNLRVGEGNNEYTDGECFLYPPSVKKVACEDIFRQSEDCPKAISDNTKITISKSNDQKQGNKKVATAEEAEEQPTETPGLDAKGKTTSEGVTSANQEVESGLHNKDEVSDTEKDTKGLLEIDGHIEYMDNFSSLKKETAELPRNPAALPGKFEASVSAADYLEKASTAVVQGPEIKAEIEKKKTQRDGDENMTSSEVEDFNMSQTNVTIDYNKESMSEIMKDVQDLGISPQESTDKVEEKKGFHEARLDCNLEEASKSLSEKEFEELNGSSDTLKSKVELEYKNIESNTESLREEIDKDKGERNEEDTFLSNTTESEISIKGTPQTVMVKPEPEDCTLKEMMMQEGKERENLDEAFTSTSENNGAVEPIEENAFSNLGEANSWIANSKDQQDDIDTLGLGNCDTADIHQDITAEANLKGATDFEESIISLNEDDSCLGDHTIAKEKRCGKQDVDSELQPEEQEKQEIEDSSQEKFDDALASEASKNTEFTGSDRKSDVETEKKIAGHGTSITKEEKIPEIVDTEPERQAIQIQEELTESESKESRIASTDKVSNLIENMDKDSVNGEQLLEKFSNDETAEEVSNTETINEAVLRKMPSDNITEEISTEPYKLPKQQNDKSAPEGSKITNEAIFSVISREHNPQQEEQFKNSNDVSNVVSITTGKANQAQENYDNSDTDTTELDSERHISESNSIVVQKDRKSCQVSRSNETNGTDIVEDTDKVNNHIQEGNSEPADENQRYSIDFEAQGLHGDAEDATTTRSTFAPPSVGSMELPEREKLSEREEAATGVEIYNQENEDANNIKDIASAEESVEPADAVERLDSCTKPDAACEDNATFVETRKPESGENSMDSKEQCAISTDILLREYHDEDQARCNAKIEILEAEDSMRKSEEADEVVKEQNSNEEPQCIKKEAIEDDVSNAMKEKEVDDKEFKITNSYPPRHHDDSSMQVIKVEAPERCGLNEVQEMEELENTRSEESSFDKAGGNQENIKISQSQNELTKDSIQVTEAETTRDTHHEDPEDGKLYNSNIDLSANLDTYTKSNSIEEENDEKTHAQAGSIEIQETEAFNKEESEDKSTCFGKQDQKIDEESASVIELNNSVSSKECMKISSKDIQVNEMEEEATIEKQQCSVESDDSSNITNSVPSYEIRRVDIAEEKLNFQNIIEVMDQDIHTKSDSIKISQDETTHEQIGFKEITNTKIVTNEKIMNHSSKESESCSAIQEHETAEACTPTPLIEVEHPIPSKDMCTSISSGDIQDSEAQEEEAMDKQIEDLDKTKEGLNAHKGRGEETLPKNESPMNILKEDINAQFSSIEIQKEAKTDEQTCSNEIHETKTVNKEIVNQSSEESDSCSSRNLGQEIAHASTLIKDVENPVPNKDKYTRSSSANFQGSELVEEASTEEQHCGAEDPDMITNNASSYKDKIAESQIIEVQKDEKPNEQTDSNVICETKATKNEDFATQNSKAVDSCSKKQDEEILENTAPSKDENTRISSEEFQASEVKEEVTTDKQQCKSETENKNKDGYSHMVTVMDIMTAPENDNSTYILENDIKAQSRSIEESKDEKTNEQTCLNETHETQAVDSEEIANQSSGDSASCIAKRDQEASQVSKLPVVEAASDAYKDECTRIPSGEIHDNEVLGETSIDKEQCISKMEDPRNINNGASSYKILGVESVLINKNSMKIVENVDQDINANSHDMEAQKDEHSKQTGSVRFHDIEAVNHKEIVNQNSKVSDYVEASIPVMEAETLVPNKEEHTRISREEHEVLEVKVEPMIENQQCSSEKQKGVEFEQENEDFAHMIDVKQAIIAELEKIEVQTGCNETHETEVVNNEEIEGQSSEESNPSSGTQDQEIAAATTQEAEGPFPSIHEPTEIFREEIEVSEVKKEPVTQDSNMTNAAYSYQIGDVDIVPATEDSIKTVEDMDQDINQSDTIELQKKEKTHEQIESNEIHEAQEANNEEILNHCSEDNDFPCGRQAEKIAEASTSVIGAQNLVASNDECTRISSDKINLKEVEEASQLEIQQYDSKTKDPNEMEIRVSSYKFERVEMVPEHENSLNKVKDVHQDTTAGLNIISVRKDDNTYEQIGFNEIREAEVVNKNKTQGQSPEESDIWGGKQDQEIVDASRPIIESENHVPSIDEYTTISSEQLHVRIKEEPTINCLETKAPNKTSDGVSSYQIRGVEIAPGNESSVNIMEDMNQDIHPKSDTIEAQKDEITHEQSASDEIHETHEVNNEEIKNECAQDSDSYNGKQDQDTAEASTSLGEAENPVPSKDECTRISSDKIQLSEVKVPAAIEKQQCYSETEDPNKIDNGVSLYKVEGVEHMHVPENENLLNKVENESQVKKELELHGDTHSNEKQFIEDVKEINVQLDSTEVQNVNEPHEKTGFNGNHESENINYEDVGNQSSKESNSCNEIQDQEIAQASIPAIEAENLVPRNDKCTSTSCEDIQLNEVEEEATTKIQQCGSEDLNKITNGAYLHENTEPAATKEMHTVELREANNAGNDATDRNIKDHVGNGTMEEAKDAHQIDKENPGTEIECKQHDSQQAIAQEETNDEAVQPEDEINIYDKQIIEGIEMPELSKSREIEGSLSFREYEARKEGILVDNYNYIIPDQQTAIGTEASEEYASIEMGILDQGQPAKKSNFHTQAGFEADCHKHENEGPEDMNSSLEEEEELGAPNEGEISSVQTALAPESGFSKENIDEDKQGIDFGENKHNLKITELPQHACDRKEFPQQVEDPSILTAEEVRKIQLTEPDHDSIDISLTEVYTKQSVEYQEFDNAKKEAKFPKATVSFVNCQDVNEATVEETIREEIWQANKPEYQLQEPSSEHLGQKHRVINIEDENESTNTMKVSREEKSHECSTTQQTYFSEEEKIELGVSSSKFMPNLDLQLEQAVEDVTKKDESVMTGPGDLSSDFQGANFPLASETSAESNIYKGSCSQGTRNEDECPILEKEQTSDISGQHDSSSELISENNIEQTSQIIGDFQGQSESFGQIKKQYIQEGRNSEDIDIEKSHKTVNRELMVAENQSKENLEEHKVVTCNPITTELMEEAIVSDDSKYVEREATKKSCQEASSAQKTRYQVHSMDTMDNASKEPGDKDGNMQDNLQAQKHENQLELIESDKIDGSNSQDTLLQGDMSEALDSSTIVEIQQANTRQMFPPHVEEPEILSAQAKVITNGSELEKDSRDVSSGEINVNQSTEKLELDYAEREVNFQNLMDVHVNCQEVDGTEVSYIFPEHVGEEPLPTASCKHEEIQGTIKPVTEMEVKADETSSEKLVKETYLSEVEQMYHKVQGLKDEPIKDLMPNQELAEKGRTTGEATVELEELSSEFEVTSSTSESKTQIQTQPMSHLDGSSQAILNENEGQSSKISVEIPNVSPLIDSGKSCGPSSNQTETFQQEPEPHGEELTLSDEADQEMHHQLKSSQLIAEEKSLPDFGAHEVTRNEDNQDKNTVLPNDPTLAQQNMSHDKEEKTVMGEEQETSMENNNSSTDGGEAVSATRQGPAEHMDSEEIYQIKDTKEDDNHLLQSIVAEKEHKLEGNLDNPSASFQLPKACNVPMEKASEELADDIVAIGDTRQLQDDSREESEELSKTEACTEKGVSIIESERNGASPLPPKDPIKQSLEEPTMENPSIVNIKSGEHVHQEKANDDPIKTQADSNTLDSTKTLSSNIKQEFSAQTSLMVSDRTAEGELVILHTEPKDEGETALVKSKSDEEKQDEHEDSDLKVPLMSEALRDMELKATHKKSHNILSGVGSKVKHSISKVKKAMTCTTSQFAPEEVIIKLNKNKNLDKA